MKRNKIFGASKRRGFALVLAIAAMAFMVLLVLTLSSVITSKLRLLNAQKENRLARSNALLGMSVAISQLQRTLGPDNAISFPASILDTDPKSVSIEGVQSPYVVGGFKLSLENKKREFKDVQDEYVGIFETLKEGSLSASENLNWFISSEKAMKNPMTESPRDLSEESIKLATFKTLSDYPGVRGGGYRPILRTRRWRFTPERSK